MADPAFESKSPPAAGAAAAVDHHPQLSLLTGRPYLDSKHANARSEVARDAVIPIRHDSTASRHDDSWFAGTAAEFWDCCGTRWEVRQSLFLLIPILPLICSVLLADISSSLSVAQQSLNAIPHYLKCAPLTPTRTWAHAIAFPLKLVLAIILMVWGLLNDIAVRLVAVLSCCCMCTEDVGCCNRACEFQFPGRRVTKMVGVCHFIRVCCCTTVARGRETDCLPLCACCPAPNAEISGHEMASISAQS